MNGLTVVQSAGTTSMYFLNEATQTPAQPDQNPIFFRTMDPQVLSELLESTVPTQDSKFFLRQYKTTGVYYNNSNTPIYIKRTSFRVRKNISKSDYQTYTALMTDQAIPVTQPLVEITTGNPAQRFMKFGKVKWQYMPCGSMRKFKLNTKFRSPKAISRDVEGNPLYLATKWTKGYMFQCIPVPRTHFTGGVLDPTFTGYTWGSFLVPFRYINYVSGYVLGRNDPSTTLNLNTLPGTGSQYPIYTDQLARPQSIHAGP